MPANTNDASTIGKRLGRLIQQYDLRIKYGQYKANLMEQEAKKASAIGNLEKETRAKVSMNAWATYADNLATAKMELAKAIQTALVAYNTTERKIWWAYFIENKSTYDIEDETSINSRSVQRAIAAMKKDMELNFEQKLPYVGEVESPKWTAQDLAFFLEEKPTTDYLSAIKDMLEYGIVDIDALEFDPDFQDYVVNGRR